MSNNLPPGNGDPIPSQQIASWNPSIVVTPDIYALNKAKITQMRDALAQYEQANETGLQNYSEQQELLKRIEMGREAERQLSQMMTAAGQSATQGNVPTATYGAAQASSSASGTPVSNHQPFVNGSFQSNSHGSGYQWPPNSYQAQQMSGGSIPTPSPTNSFPPPQSWTNGPIDPQGRVSYQARPPDVRGSHATVQVPMQAHPRQYQPPPASSAQRPTTSPVIGSHAPAAMRYPQQQAGSSRPPMSHSPNMQQQSGSFSNKAPPTLTDVQVREQVQHVLRALQKVGKEALCEVLRLTVKQLETKVFPNGVPSNLHLRPMANGWSDAQKANIIQMGRWVAEKLDVLPSDVLLKTLQHIREVAHAPQQNPPQPRQGPLMAQPQASGSGSGGPPMAQSQTSSSSSGGPTPAVSSQAPAVSTLLNATSPQEYYRPSGANVPTQSTSQQSYFMMTQANGFHVFPIQDKNGMLGMSTGGEVPVVTPNQSNIAAVQAPTIQLQSPPFQAWPSPAVLVPPEQSYRFPVGQASRNPPAQFDISTRGPSPPIPPPTVSAPGLSLGPPSPPKRTPAMADKSRLARDIMRTLGSSYPHLVVPPKDSQLSSSTSALSTPTMPSEFKGKRKATDDEISYPGKHQKMYEEPEVKSLVAPEPSAPQVLEVMPEPTPMVVDPSSSALSPALPSLTPLPTDDAPSFTVLQDTGPSGAADLQADESVASADTKEEQVDQLMEDEDIEEYTEIKTPGVIQLEVEAQDEALKIALVPDLDSAPLVSSGFHISSSPEPPNLDIAPGPPSSHVTVTPPPDDHNLSIPFSLPQPSHSTSVIEQMLSQHFEQTVSPHLQAPSLPLLEHLIDADPLHPSNSSNLQRQDSSPQPPKAGPSKLPLFLPSDDDGSGSDDVILLATPRKTKARAPPSPGLMNDDFFILDASLLAGPELPSHALRTTRQPPVAAEGGSGARPKQRRVGGAAHRRQGHGTHRFAYVEIPSRPNWVEKIKAREEKRAGKQKAKTTAKVRARSESVVPATPEPGELQLGGGGDEAGVSEEAKRNQEIDDRAASQVSYSRLRETRCRWRGCDAVLNCAERLASHASTHAQEKDVLRGFICEWDSGEVSCLRNLVDRQRLAQHLRNHAYYPLRCAFQDCEASFESSRELSRHHKLPRHVGDTLRPTAGVLAPDLTDMHLPELPGGEVPTFLTDGLQVQQAAISRKLHEWLAPQVQDNIRGLGSRRTLTKMSVKRNSRLLEKIPAVTRAMREDPNATILSKARKPRDPFLPWKTSSRRRGPKFCSDFPTKEVSVLISQGYVCKGLPEEDADAELLEAYREMDEAGSSGDDEIEVDDYDMQVDVVNDTDDAIEDFDDDVGVVIERDHADPIGTNDPQAAEEEDVTADGQPSVSLPNTDGGGAGSEHGGDEGTLAGPSEVPPASATRDDDGMEGETGDQTLGSTSISAGASSVVMGGSMHLLDGDQETRQQVERNSQPAKEVSL